MSLRCRCGGGNDTLENIYVLVPTTAPIECLAWPLAILLPGKRAQTLQFASIKGDRECAGALPPVGTCHDRDQGAPQPLLQLLPLLPLLLLLWWICPWVVLAIAMGS